MMVLQSLSYRFQIISGSFQA